MPDWNPRPLCYTTELHTKSSIAESDLYLAIFSSTLANNKIYGPPLHPLQMLLAALIHSEAVKSKTVPALYLIVLNNLYRYIKWAEKLVDR